MYTHEWWEAGRQRAQDERLQRVLQSGYDTDKKRLIMQTVEQWNKVPRKFVLLIPLEVFSIRLDRDLKQHGLISELV